MVSKMTVLTLLTLLCLAMANEQSVNQKIREEYLKQMSNNANNGNQSYDQEIQEINDEVLGLIAVFYVLAFCIVAGINIFLCIKCLRKRAISSGIKQQIQMKRMEFATMNGLNLRTLNDPRYSQTIHA